MIEKKRFGIVALFIAFMVNASFHVCAEEADLVAIYQKALAHDALLASVRFENEATQELISQGRSLFLPSITATANYGENDNERKILTPGISSNELLSGNKAEYHDYDYGITTPLATMALRIDSMAASSSSCLVFCCSFFSMSG